MEMRPDNRTFRPHDGQVPTGVTDRRAPGFDSNLICSSMLDIVLTHLSYFKIVDDYMQELCKIGVRSGVNTVVNCKLPNDF